jgi:hypothetical protein
MSQNIGTLITAAIRPSDSTLPIASVYANEGKGGHQSFENFSDMYSVIQARREWGMLVTIYNDTNPDNNKTYKLSYGHYNTDIMNNNNWVAYNPLGIRVPTEWIDSALSVVTDPPTAVDGDRFIISSAPNPGTFYTYPDYVVQYDSTIAGGWIYFQPTPGMSLRLDSIDNIIYKYNGTYSSGYWSQEWLNQVRYITATSSNGLSYSAISSPLTKVDSYSYSVYYVNFGMTNSGPISLQIDSLDPITVEKLSGSSLLPLVSTDIIPDTTYQLLYNSSNNTLQTTVTSNNNVIGPNATGGATYNGLYPFVSSTPVGTPIDYFNQVLQALVPPSAPTLRSWSATGSFTTGKLSFDASIGGYSPGYVSATASPYESVAINGSYTASTFGGYRLGIMSTNAANSTYYKDISGILNNNVLNSTTTPTPAYITYSFGSGNVGTVSLYLNGSTISSIGLYNISATDSTSNGSVSGLSFSGATSSKFPSGYTFETFWNRTGTWLIKKNDTRIVPGYNFITVKHDILPISYTLSQYEFVNDPDSTATTFSGAANTPNLTGYTTKYLSGIEYYNSLSSNIVYAVTINNLYRSTYYSGSDGISYADTSTPGINGVYGSVNTNSSSPIFTPVTSQQSIPAGTSTASIATVGTTFSLNSGVRRINDSISFATSVKRTVQSNVTNQGSGTTTNLFIDTVITPTASNTIEWFNDEGFRLQNATTKYDTYITLVSDISSYTWSSTQSLTLNSRYNNGLQVINANLIYPTFRFDNAGISALTNPNFIKPNRDYSITGALTTGLSTTSSPGYGTSYRTFTRYFFVGTSTSYQNFTLNVTYNGTLTPVSVTSALSSNNCWVEVKLPYNGTGTPTKGLHSGSVTGWMDASQSIGNTSLSSSYDDGAGCLDGSVPTTSGSNWLLNMGLQSTLYSSGYVLFRITLPQSYTGQITKITLVGR